MSVVAVRPLTECSPPPTFLQPALQVSYTHTRPLPLGLLVSRPPASLGPPTSCSRVAAVAQRLWRSATEHRAQFLVAAAAGYDSETPVCEHVKHTLTKVDRF